MKPVEIEDICTYTFYGGLKSCGSRLIYVSAKADIDQNRYDYYLNQFAGGSFRQLSGLGQESSFIVKDDHTLLFTGNRLKKEGHTFIYELDLNGGEALPIADLEEESVVCCGLFHDQLVLQISRTLHREEKDYEIFDELPFYFNGQGIISKNRTGLYLFNLETRQLQAITDENFDTGQVKITSKGIYYTGQNVGPVRSVYDGLYFYDGSQSRQLIAEDQLTIMAIEPAADKVVLFASDLKTWGLNSNPDIYEWDQGLKKVCALDLAFTNTVGTDCRLGPGNVILEQDGIVYFAATVAENVHLFSYENGQVREVLTWQGSIDAFAFMDHHLYFIGAAPARLQQLYQVSGQEVKQLSDFNALFEDTYVALPQAISYPGYDGNMLEGWVLYPKDFDPQKKYPAILDIHGGPKTVYGTIFYHEMQVWAGQGYFVFFCNPHGSDGFGNGYADIRGRYGTIDYEDLMNFTDTVLKAIPQIDPQRLGVTGGSYGGFMTNWIITHTHRFKAAATQRSISNWTSFAGTSDIGPDFVKDQQAGDVDDIQTLWKQSPISRIRYVQTPTLIIHSDEDYRCPMEQGMQMLSGILGNGVQARMCVFHGENHELSRSGKPRHRIRRLKEITGWMNDHLL